MASALQHIAAFFDPTVAVNDEGYLVEANGFFDSGDTSTDYLAENSLSDTRDFFYGTSQQGPFNNSDGFYALSNSIASNSDGVSEAEQLLLDAYKDDLFDAANQQQQASQASADTAMEFNAEQARLNREFQAEQNQKAMDFSERMSNTAYQRAMADMQAAGLNPKLVGQLGGASSPSGVTSSGSAASGQAASMSVANYNALASVISSYITGADALDRNQNDFVKSLLTAFMYMVGK